MLGIHWHSYNRITVPSGPKKPPKLNNRDKRRKERKDTKPLSLKIIPLSLTPPSNRTMIGVGVFGGKPWGLGERTKLNIYLVRLRRLNLRELLWTSGKWPNVCASVSSSVQGGRCSSYFIEMWGWSETTYKAISSLLTSSHFVNVNQSSQSVGYLLLVLRIFLLLWPL